jgi:hypothetical protein
MKLYSIQVVAFFGLMVGISSSLSMQAQEFGARESKEELPQKTLRASTKQREFEKQKKFAKFKPTEQTKQASFSPETKKEVWPLINSLYKKNIALPLLYKSRAYAYEPTDYDEFYKYAPGELPLMIKEALTENQNKLIKLAELLNAQDQAQQKNYFDNKMLLEIKEIVKAVYPLANSYQITKNSLAIRDLFKSYTNEKFNALPNIMQLLFQYLILRLDTLGSARASYIKEALLLKEKSESESLQPAVEEDVDSFVIEDVD